MIFQKTQLYIVIVSPFEDNVNQPSLDKSNSCLCRTITGLFSTLKIARTCFCCVCLISLTAMSRHRSWGGRAFNYIHISNFWALSYFSPWMQVWFNQWLHLANWLKFRVPMWRHKALDPEMGNLGLGRPPLDEEEQKAGFRACLERTCVPQVQKVLQLRSANSLGAQFQMVTAGRAETRPDPVNSDIAKQASDADARLLECERQCARRYWPDALEQPWLGTVSVEMAGIARDQTRGNSRTGRFTWAPAVKKTQKNERHLGGIWINLSLTHQSRFPIRNHLQVPDRHGGHFNCGFYDTQLEAARVADIAQSGEPRSCSPGRLGRFGWCLPLWCQPNAKVGIRSDAPQLKPPQPGAARFCSWHDNIGRLFVWFYFLSC